jgi:hypothetical protein
MLRGDNAPQSRRPILHRYRHRRLRIDTSAPSQPAGNGRGQDSLIPGAHLETQVKYGADGRLLAAAAIVALSAGLLLATIAAALLCGPEVLHARHHHAAGQSAHQILHVGLTADKALLSAVPALKHLCWVSDTHAAETSLLP